MSGGSTGAVMASSLLFLRPLAGVDRPAIGTVLPTSKGPTLLLDAGANVVTSLVPPGQGLVGVAQNSLDIEDGKRTSDTVLSALKTYGLNAASKDEYQSWIEKRKEAVKGSERFKEVAC